MRYDKLIKHIRMWDERLTRAGVRMGLNPYPTRYELVGDDQMVRLIPYVMLPSHYRHWSFGKKYEQQMKNGGNFHIFEAVINSSPSFCYLGVTNRLPMQLLVMAHAKWGHVDFFANNHTFSDSGADSIIERLAQGAEFVKRLSRDPIYGVEKVEFILDAAHALDDHCGWVPAIKDRATDKMVRKELEVRLVELRQRLRQAESSEFETKAIQSQIDEVAQMLRRDPINPAADVLGFIADARNNPRLGDEERGLISIVRDQALYLHPQARTKFMNEGWASYWEKHLLLQPELGLPVNWLMEMPQYWSMHDRQATAWYFDPYALGLEVFDFIDRTYGFDEGEIEVDAPSFTTREATEEDKAEESDFQYRTADGKVIEWTGETHKVKTIKRNRDKMLQVRKNHEDKSFFREFLNKDLITEINDKALKWFAQVAGIISRQLHNSGFNPAISMHPIEPKLTNASLEQLNVIVETWMNQAQMGEQLQQQGWPAFPVPAQTLQVMGTILQLVAGYDADKAKFRNMFVLRTGRHSVPDIEVVDGGPLSQDLSGTLTLRHVFDPTFGFLMQSECRDTVRFARRIWGRPTRLLTMEQAQDRWGRPIGQPRPFEYLCDEDGEVRERYLPDPV